jgi:hypothetical protein
VSRVPVFALSVLCVLVYFGCEKRDRLNPFDPGNPDTGGLPSFIDARAGNHRVALEWDLGEFGGIVATRIQRRVDGQAISNLTPALNPAIREFLDTSAQNGIAYEYRLEIELISGARQATAWDAATPGDAIPWVVDSDGGGLSRLTPDARDQLTSVGAGRWFLDLAIDTSTATVWSVDFLQGELFQRRPSGGCRCCGSRCMGRILRSASARTSRPGWIAWMVL